MTHRTDVLVVGGGATGAGIARDLALRGVDVTLADRGGLSSGTTGRSHGLLHSGARYAEADEVGARECIAENEILREVAGHCIGDTGGLFVQLEEDDPDYFDTKLAACREYGIDAEVISGDEARARVPGLAAAVERAMVVPDAVVYPSRLVAANAADVERHGGTVLRDAPLESFALDEGRITGARLGGEADVDVDATYVVNATGAWAGQVAEKAGVEVEMRPTSGVMVSVDYADLGPVLNRCRDPADGDIIIPHDDQVVLGTTSNVVDDPDDYPKAQAEVDKMFEECGDMLPPVRDAETIRTWWGVRPLYAPDEDARGSQSGGSGANRGISRGFFVLDHADEGVENFVSVVGGKLTSYRLMAEETADLVADRLGVDEPCRTAEAVLPGASDPAELNEFVSAYDARSPTDEDVVADD
ncbi:FAD-dependent oxidoreductase [Salinigranum halophilum]|jgi:glycerol-3-phosphate dehydrogenase|uniref:FAD-dependent oxidoreductase n=1 Tax=Salinigranum halophilum TaxID=2565931 RepID=UPI0010A90887|nr:FAD-dependent oxidoreductase [Salinigranum halophilum]